MPARFFMRLVIQSLNTGRFLCPSLDGGDPVWVASLREAGGGVMFDLESAQQIFSEWCDFDERPVVVDLDRLGTANDY